MLWRKYFTNNGVRLTVSRIAFRTDGAKVLILFDNDETTGNLRIAYVSATDGSIYYVYQDTTMTSFKIYDAIRVTTSDRVYMGF
jgi:hypothetical protein